MNNHQSKSLKSCCDLEYLLIGDLRQLLRERIPPNHQIELRVLLKRLLQNLPEVTKRSSTNGYMASVLEKCPRLHRQITTLQTANLECLKALKVLYDSIERQSSFKDISAETDRKLGAWVDSLGRMRSRESQLLMDAFTVDIGGEA
jgi:hypothetical protein